MVHFMRNVLSKVSHKHMTWAASKFKAVFAMETASRCWGRPKAWPPRWTPRALRRRPCLKNGVGEATTYLLDAPAEHWR